MGKGGKKRQETTFNKATEKPVRKLPIQNIVINQDKLVGFYPFLEAYQS